MTLFGITFACILISRWPVSRISVRIPKRDVEVRGEVGDIFNQPGDLLIACSSSFDTEIGDLVAPDSLLGQFIQRFYTRASHLDQDIEHALIGQKFMTLPDNMLGKRRKYPLGTVAKVHVDTRNVYLVALTNKGLRGNAEPVTFDCLQTVLSTVWNYLLESGDLHTLNVPLLGTGRGRITQTRFDVFKATVNSFIAANAQSRFCNKLAIVIYRVDYSAHNELNLAHLYEYLHAVCLTTEYADPVSIGREQSVPNESDLATYSP